LASVATKVAIAAAEAVPVVPYLAPQAALIATSIAATVVAVPV